MARELQALYVRPAKVWNMYMTVVLGFAALYFTFFCFQRSSFQVDGYAADATPDTDKEGDAPGTGDSVYEDLQTANDIPTVFIYFCYFSGAIMTSTGFGDIAPTLWYSQAATNVQMLLGTMYHVGVFGLTLSHFRTFQKISEEQEKAQQALLDAGGGAWYWKAWRRFTRIPLVAMVRNHRYTANFKQFCLKYLVLVCVVFQSLNTLLLLSIPDPFRPLTKADGAKYWNKVVVLTFITLFQTAMFVGVMWISIRLVKKINNKDITPGFLLQSFLATALLFGGIYLVLYASTPNHQFSRNTSFDLTPFEVLYVFVHFSLTVMTTTGFGDVYARGIIARM
jgi:TRAP-type C4-dicarboxylate transport system permease small subunit